MRTPEQRQHMYDVADAIENEPDQFDMSHYICGSNMCIAGWSVALRGGNVRLMEADEVDSDCATHMGIDMISARRLFGGEGIHTAEEMPDHLRAKGMADAVRQIADGATVTDALRDVRNRYGGAL